MSKEVTVTFQGELGIELNVDRASGTVRIKRAEADSPAKPHEGAALRAINGKPVGKIVDKAAWLALVERLKAPARPLVLALAVPEDPVQRARAELDALAASAKAEAEAAAAASAPAPTRGRLAFKPGMRFGPRSRSPSPELTCSQCGRTGTRADGFFNGARGNGYRGLFCGEACQAKSAGRSGLERASKRAPKASSSRRRRSRSRSRSPRRRRKSSPPGRNRHEAAAAPAAPHAALGLDEKRPTRRHLAAAAESAPAPQPPVESKPSAGPRSLSDAEIYDMVLAREKARIVKDYATADRMRAEMAAAGLTVVYRDVTGRGDKNRGAVTWSTVDGREGPPSMSRIEIETRLRAWLHARNVDKNPSRAGDLLADCAARGLGTSASGGQLTWFTAQGQHGTMQFLVRDARSPRSRSRSRSRRRRSERDRSRSRSGGRRRRDRPSSRGDEDDRDGAQRLRGVYRASVRYGAQGNETRRYGFITPAGLEPDTRTDVFMHADDVREGSIVQHGDSVEYTLVPCRRTGKERAVDVVKIRFRSPELSLEGTIAARTKRILAGDHGIRAQFDDRTLTVRTLRAAVAKSLGLDEAAVKKVVKQTLMDALEAEPRRPRGVFNLVPRGFKRFGFITPDGGGEDMFAHLENVRAGHVVEDRNAVEYGIGRGPDGRDQAVDIVPVPSPPPPPSEASEDSGAAAPVLVIDVGSPRKRGR